MNFIKINYSILFICWTTTIAILYLFGSVNCQTKELGFGFPEAEEHDKSKQNAHNKKPVYIPNKCGINELLYPGDHKDDWVCDCKPGYIYYPQNDKCYSAYRRGPCIENEYLILPPLKVIPECYINPCKTDGDVYFRNDCYTLNKAGPCELPELSYVVGINETTLDITCIQLSSVQFINSDLASRFGSDDDSVETTTTAPLTIDDNSLIAPTNVCNKGSKRAIDGKCPDTDTDKY